MLRQSKAGEDKNQKKEKKEWGDCEGYFNRLMNPVLDKLVKAKI